MESSCRLQSELRPALGIGSLSRVRSPLYWPLSHACSPGHKGPDDLTSSSPSSALSAAVSYGSPPLRGGNIGPGLRSLRDLTQHLPTRGDHSQAPAVTGPNGHRTSTAFPVMSSPGKVLRVASN